MPRAPPLGPQPPSLGPARRLDYWEGLELAFLKNTEDAAQYYDEGADGRCGAYDPFNTIDSAGSTATNAHKYARPAAVLLLSGTGS